MIRYIVLAGVLSAVGSNAYGQGHAQSYQELIESALVQSMKKGIESGKQLVVEAISVTPQNKNSVIICKQAGTNQCHTTDGNISIQEYIKQSGYTSLIRQDVKIIDNTIFITMEVT